MRKLFLALAAVTALGIVLPVVSTPADAQTVVVKKKSGDRGWHRGHRNKVIIKSDRRRHYHHHHARADRVVIVKKKRTPRAAVTIRAN
jgi:hypothetical protein